MKKLLNLAILLVLLVTFGYSQQVYQATQAGSGIMIKGKKLTGTWEMFADKLTSTIKVEFDNGQISKIENVTFQMPVKKLNAINDEDMVKKARKALKAKEFPTINFIGKRVDSLVNDGNKFTGIITGDLTVAGVTKTISFEFNGENKGKNIIIKAIPKLDMRDFGITPPKYLGKPIDPHVEVYVKMKYKKQ